MQRDDLIGKFKSIVFEHGGLNDSSSAYVALLYLVSERQKVFSDVDSNLKDVEAFVKSYFGRFGANVYADVLKAVESLKLTKEDYRVLLSFLLSGTAGHFDECASSIEMTQLVSEIFEVRPNEIILDFGSGNGAFLCTLENVLSERYVPASYIGVEPDASAARISQYALQTVGCVYEIQIANGFSIPTPQYNKGFVFPPAGLKQSKTVLKSLPEGKLFDGRSSYEWAFVFKALEGMKNNGKLVALLPEWCLFKDGDSEIRKHLLDEGLVEGIISFPAKSLIGTFRKYNLVVFSRGNDTLRLVDGTDLFETLEIRTFDSRAVEAICYSYFEGNAKKIRYSDIKKGDYSLAVGSLLADEGYEGLADLVPFESIYDLKKGTPKTTANFKDSISESPTNWRILTSGNIVDGEIDYDSMPYVYFDPSHERYEAVEGDIIVSTKSSKIKIAIVEKHGPYRIVVTGGMMILRPKVPVCQLYTKLFLESEKGERILASAQRGTVITILSPAVLAKIKIPFPPVETQREFVADYKAKREEARKARQALRAIEQELDHYFDRKTQKGE